MKSRLSLPKKPWLVCGALASLVCGALLFSSLIRRTNSPIFCTLAGFGARAVYPTDPIQLSAILHYATSTVVPQQSLGEIRVTFDVLRSLSPCNFLVFGLGHDSLMWASFNPNGTTRFLEEDPEWVQTILNDAPDLLAHSVKYRTKLSEADDLLSSYRSKPECSRFRPGLRNNLKCKLALRGLPDEVYDTEWDLIMIDAPRGYYAEAPGRMGAIYSAAVMAASRKRSGVTHVFLHDVDRVVEKAYAEEFLCKKHLVMGVERLWHFEIPPAANVSSGSRIPGFC